MKVLFLLFAMAISASCDPLSEFKKAEILSDVLKGASLTSLDSLTVSYGSEQVNYGNELSTTSVKNAPTVMSWKNNATDLYALVMVDPDAPSRTNPTYREFKHWLVVNIPGENISKGDTLAGYRGAGPPQGTGLHRYIFLTYRQAGKISFSPSDVVDSTSRDNRPSFKVQKYAEQNRLLGPIAGNFFQAQHSDN